MSAQMRAQPLSPDLLREPGDPGAFAVPEPIVETPDQPIADERRVTPNRAPGFGMRDAIRFGHNPSVPYRETGRPYRGTLLIALMFSPVWVIMSVAIVFIALSVW